MCLSTVVKKLDGTSTVIESGWKYFEGAAIAPQFQHQKWKGSKYCLLNTWLTAENPSFIMAGPGLYAKYEAGFHVFTDEAKAKRLKNSVRRVYFRRGTAVGIDQGVETVVAQELYVPSKEEDWPKG